MALKKSILGNTYIVLTNEQFKEFAAKGVTTHDEDGRRFHIAADDRGFPVVVSVEWLKEPENENPVVSWSTKADYIEAGIKPFDPSKL